MVKHSTPTPVRTIMISDLHLGSLHSQSEKCLDFLRSYQPQQIYLVGDFIDGWRCSPGWHWPSSCQEIVDYLNDLIQQGTEIFYVPGNHDSFLRSEQGLDQFASGLTGDLLTKVRLADEFVFESSGGWRFLITHGDLFDVVETQAQWVSKTTSFVYDAILSLNRVCNRMPTRRHKNPYGACAALKSFVKRLVMRMSDFEPAIMQHARRQDCDGVICGHIHTPTIVYSEEMLYLNTGDWVENCTGMVEYHDGSIRLESVYGSPRMLDLPFHPRHETTREPRRELEIA